MPRCFKPRDLQNPRETWASSISRRPSLPHRLARNWMGAPTAQLRPLAFRVRSSGSLEVAIFGFLWCSSSLRFERAYSRVKSQPAASARDQEYEKTSDRADCPQTLGNRTSQEWEQGQLYLIDDILPRWSLADASGGEKLGKTRIAAPMHS
jgi:hypothetical protein